jgi:hypothetical protein
MVRKNVLLIFIEQIAAFHPYLNEQEISLFIQPGKVLILVIGLFSDKSAIFRQLQAIY